MRILISGGTGMIGTPLVNRLQENGHKVWILSRKTAGINILPDIELIHWDGFSIGDWGDYINQADAIINLAGENIGAMRWSDKRKQQILGSRINTGKILTDAIGKATSRPKVFIQASAIGYYGSEGKEILTEESSSGNDLLADICRKWEASSCPVESMGIRRIVVRTGVVLSRSEGALNRMLMPFILFVGGPIGTGKQIISWIHPADEVAAIQYLLENNDARGVYNLTSPESISNAELGKKLAKIIHRPYWLPVPAFGLRLLLGEMSSLVLEGQNVAPKKLLGAGFRFKFGKIDEALKDLLT